MYKSKKTRRSGKLESTNANLERVNDIISEIEGRIDGLREDSAKAKEYLTLRERYQELEINLTLKNVERLETANETLRGDVQEMVTAINDSGKGIKVRERQIAF